MIRKGISVLKVFLVMVSLAGAGLLLLPRIFHLVPHVVLSGSMEPRIPAGSIVYVSEAVLPEQVEVQDVIAFERLDNALVLHRVIGIDAQNSTFATKGDANDTADIGTVSFSQYKGKLFFYIPYIGYLVKSFQLRFWILAGIAGMLFWDRKIKKKGGQYEKNNKKNTG